ncbi:hypothetical protein ONZ45_g7458 [Pleurotus djamor]|nr:hypothetical protein ONZ45_g7458 [Pleurotus djamor]
MYWHRSPQIALPGTFVTSLLRNSDVVQSIAANQVVPGGVSEPGSGVGPSPTSGSPLPSSTGTSNPPIEPTKPTTIVAATLTTGIVILFIIISYTLYRCRRRDARRLNRLSGSSSKPLVEKGTSVTPSPQQLEEGIVDTTRQSWQSSLSGFSMVQATNRDYQATARNSGHGITFQDPFWDPSEGGVAQAITLSRTPSLTHSISSDAPSTSSSDDGRSTRVRSFISDHSTTTTASSIAIAGPGVNRKNSIVPGPRLAALFGIFGASGHYAPNRRDTIMSKLSRLSRGGDIEHPTQATPEDKRKSTSGKSDTGSTRNAILNATWNSPFVVSLFTSRSRRDRTP